MVGCKVTLLPLVLSIFEPKSKVSGPVPMAESRGLLPPKLMFQLTTNDSFVPPA